MQYSSRAFKLAPDLIESHVKQLTMTGGDDRQDPDPSSDRLRRHFPLVNVLAQAAITSRPRYPRRAVFPGPFISTLGVRI